MHAISYAIGQTTRDAAHSRQRTIDELGKSVERLFESGTPWIRQKFE